MKKSLLLALLATGFIAYSQTVSYSLLEDDPYKRNFHASLLPFYVDYGINNNTSIGWGLEGNVTIKKIASANFYFEKSYGGMMDMGYYFATKEDETYFSSNKAVNFHHLELGGTFHLRDRAVSKGVDVTVASGNRSKTVAKGIPATVRRITGVRGGLYNYATALDAGTWGSVKDSLDVGEGVIADDGTRLGDMAGALGNVVTNMKVFGFYGGFSFQSYRRVAIDASGYGQKNHSKWAHFYIDGILGVPTIDDVIAQAGEKTYKVNGGNAKGFETRPFGARLGFEYSWDYHMVGWYAKAEGGIKPGLSASPGYMTVAIGISINGNIKALEPATKE